MNFDVFTHCKIIFKTCLTSLGFSLLFSAKMLGGGSADNVPSTGASNECCHKIFVEINTFKPMHPVFFRLVKREIYARVV